MLKIVLKALSCLCLSALLIGVVYLGLKIYKQVEDISCEVQDCTTLKDASLLLAEKEKEVKFFNYHWSLEYKLPDSSLWKITVGIGPFFKTADIKENYNNYKVVLESEEDLDIVENFLKENSIKYSTGRE